MCALLEKRKQKTIPSVSRQIKQNKNQAGKIHHFNGDHLQYHVCSIGKSWDMPNRHYVQPSICEQGSPRRSGKDRHRRQGAVSLRVSLGRRTVYPLSAREKQKRQGYQPANRNQEIRRGNNSWHKRGEVSRKKNARTILLLGRGGNG